MILVIIGVMSMLMAALLAPIEEVPDGLVFLYLGTGAFTTLAGIT